MNFINKQKKMTYFTSWDANVFLCLVDLGVPDDLVVLWVKRIKKTHEEYSLDEARSYWVSNSPTLVNMGLSARPSPFPRFKFCVPNVSRQSEISEVWKKRIKNAVEFKTEWRLRSIEERQKKVIDWCKFGNEQEQLRHRLRLNKPVHMPFVRSKSIAKEESKLLKERKEYTKNLWQTWEACASSYYFVGQNRRNYISKWYEGIHPGRFFLFYRENKIIQERNRGVPSGPCEDGYQFPKIPIFDWGPYEQLIEDLRCIDGPGLGEPSGSKIEHIDDLFSQ